MKIKKVAGSGMFIALHLSTNDKVEAVSFQPLREGHDCKKVSMGVEQLGKLVSSRNIGKQNRYLKRASNIGHQGSAEG